MAALSTGQILNCLITTTQVLSKNYNKVIKNKKTSTHYILLSYIHVDEKDVSLKLKKKKKRSRGQSMCKKNPKTTIIIS